MKKLLLCVFVLSCVLCGYSQSMSGDDILAFVRSKLPNDPLKLTGSLKVRTKNGFTKASMPVEMELDWGATTPTATYRIGESGSREFQSLVITWRNENPSYSFSDPANQPTSDVLGTGITWADLSFSVLWWPNSKLVGEEKKINRDCYVVDVPVPASKNTMQLWIEKNMGMLLEAQTLDSKKKEISRLKIVSIKKMDGMWVAKDLELRDKKTGTKTTLQIADLEWKNPKPTTEAFDPAESVNDLACDLYKKLSVEKDGNLFLSPYSISSALAMAYGGARGETAEQMNQTLHFGGKTATHPAFAYLRKALNKIQEKGYIELSVANSLWPQMDYAFLPEYIDLSKEFYGSEINPVNYQTDTEGARRKINGWVEQQTNERIKDLIPEGMLDPMTRLVLANAIYFKGAWANRFDPDRTFPEPFTLADGTKADVPMMVQTAEFRMASANGFRALELPYAGDDLSMLILLPNQTDGLPVLEEALTSAMIDSLSFDTHEVMVRMPMFKIESSFSLADTFSAMGMPLAFSRQADFSGMDGSKSLYINAIVHKAFVEVNEEGTEAAAATAVGIRLTSLPPQFIANHPFLFLIRENSTGTILFIGRVMDPSK